MFQQISNTSGGRCSFLDINSKSGDDMLTELVCAEVLRNVGGDQKGEILVQAYKAKYKSYV